jgi:CubicO group peptidase (beta-lactamase class C family)
MRPRDFLKLGQLFLDGGRWRGRQIVSRRWVERSTQPSSSLNREHDYGYTWHLNDYHVGAKSLRAYSAEGNGGQLLVVVPELDLALMLTAGNYNDFRVWSKFRDEWVPQFILSAAH